jgi:hypothetical protein
MRGRHRGERTGPLFRVKKVPDYAFVGLADDLSAAEIERKFQQRLLEIRQLRPYRVEPGQWGVSGAYDPANG